MTGKMKIATLLTAALISTFSPASSAGDTIVTASGGGHVNAFGAEIAAYSGEPVKLRGTNASAAIMWLYKGCVIADGPDQTWLVFHGPSYNGAPMAPADFDAVSAYIAAHYPPAIGAWFMSTGRYDTHHKSARWAISMGAQECDK